MSHEVSLLQLRLQMVSQLLLYFHWSPRCSTSFYCVQDRCYNFQACDRCNLDWPRDTVTDPGLNNVTRFLHVLVKCEASTLFQALLRQIQRIWLQIWFYYFVTYFCIKVEASHFTSKFVFLFWWISLYTFGSQKRCFALEIYRPRKQSCCPTHSWHQLFACVGLLFVPRCL